MSNTGISVSWAPLFYGQILNWSRNSSGGTFATPPAINIHLKNFTNDYDPRKGGGQIVSEIILSDYFYGDESEQFIYFCIPRLLITSPRLKHLSTDAKLLYGMLLGLMSLSAKNNWYDEDGRVYIYYTVEEICVDMNCGRNKAMKLLAELDTGKGVGLIERIKQGQGKPTKIYVKRFTTRVVPPPAPPEPDSFMPIPEVDFSNIQKSENRLQEVGNPDLQRLKNPTLTILILTILIEVILILVILIHPSLPLPHTTMWKVCWSSWWMW